MKVRELFDFLRGVVPHAYPETVLTAWLNEVEGRVQTEVLLLQDKDLTRLVWPDCEGQELFAKFPYDSIYWTYLAAMCAYASGEMEDYNNHLTLFNERWCMYSAWYADNYRPADGHAVEREYYLTAFSIAQRHGFEGTEDEWLASLKGDKGEPLHWEDLTPEQKAELKGEPGDENVFMATYGVTTYAELEEARGSNMMTFVLVDGLVIPLLEKNEDAFLFSRNTDSVYYSYTCAASGWTRENQKTIPTDLRVKSLEESEENLQQRATDLEDAVAGLKNAVVGLESDVGDLQGKIAAVDLAVSDMGSEVDECKEKGDICAQNIAALENRVTELEENGGGGDFVAVYGETTIHEIYAAMEAGKQVVLRMPANDMTDMLQLPLIAYDMESEIYATFGAVVDGVCRYAKCDEDGTWTKWTVELATENQIGDIDAAMDAIIAMQNSLMGGDGV
jgi:hypothetical protein